MKPDLEWVLFGSGCLIAVLIAAYAAIILWKIHKGKIQVSGLLSEPGSNKASLSRFQFLVFTFVIGLSYFLLVLETLANGTMPAGGWTLPDISGGVLGLLGISGGSYVISKGIQREKDGESPDNSKTETGTGGWHD